MTLLVLLTVAFGLVHAVPGHRAMKTFLRQRLGKAYGPVYGVLSLLLLAGMLWAYRHSPSIEAFQTADWAWWANWGFSLAGFIFLGIFLFRGSWRNQLRYPMAIGVGAWATGHILANGDGRSLVFFGGLAGFAALQVFLSKQSGPFEPAPERTGHNFLSVLFGVALYGITTQLHYALTGMELIQLK
jgi:uncharacterized membrane protein